MGEALLGGDHPVEDLHGDGGIEGEVEELAEPAWGEGVEGAAELVEVEGFEELLPRVLGRHGRGGGGGGERSMENGEWRERFGGER